MDEKDYAEAMYLMDRRHDWDYLYRQLAEECAELGHAALKLVRAGKDETPVHIEDALQFAKALLGRIYDGTVDKVTFSEFFGDKISMETGTAKVKMKRTHTTTLKM